MTDIPEFAQLAPFTTATPLVLTRFPNGGWTVQQAGDYGEIAKPLGSFSNAADMLFALQAYLGDAQKVLHHG